MFNKKDLAAAKALKTRGDHVYWLDQDKEGKAIYEKALLEFMGLVSMKDEHAWAFYSLDILEPIEQAIAEQIQKDMETCLSEGQTT